MNNPELAKVVRDRAEAVAAEMPERASDFHTAELLRVLARLLEGKTIYRAFGAPGDWGYSNPIGATLSKLYSEGRGGESIHA